MECESQCCRGNLCIRFCVGGVGVHVTELAATLEHKGHELHVFTWMGPAKRGRNRKGVVTIHSTEYGRCGNQFWDGQSARIRDQERAITYWADRLIAVSNHLRDEIIWMYEVPHWKVATIYNGVNIGNYDGIIDPGEVKRRYQIGPVDPMIVDQVLGVYASLPSARSAAA